MKNKLFSLLLSLLALSALVFCLASCSSEEDPNKNQTQNRNFVTLNMWVIWDGHETDGNGNVPDSVKDIELAVEDAFNVISRETYSTKVVFNWFKDETSYKAALAEKYAAIEGSATNNPIGEAEGEYPALKEKQLDLVLMLDKEMLNSYASTGKLQVLDTLFTTSGKKLYNEMSSVIDFTKIAYEKDDQTTPGVFAIPNLNSVGEYTYLLVNKEAADYYHTGLGNTYNSISDCVDLIEEVASDRDGFATQNNMSALLAPFDYYRAFFYTPYTMQDGTKAGDSFLGNAMIGGQNGLLASFWNANSNPYSSMLGTFYDASGETLTNSDYMTYLAVMNYCTANNEYAVSDVNAYNGEAFAVGVMQGNYELRNEFGDEYYCIVLDKPRMTDEDLFSGMWAISKYTVNAERSMEIIQALLTDANLVNTLVYGVEGTHYRAENDGTVVPLGTYYMEPRHAGNLYNVLPNKSLGQSVAWLDGRKIQKTEWDRDYFAGFYYQETLSKPKMDILQQVSNDIFDELYAVPTAGKELGEYVRVLKAKALELKETYWAKTYVIYEANGPQNFEEAVYNTTVVGGAAIDMMTQTNVLTTLSGSIKEWEESMTFKNLTKQ